MTKNFTRPPARKFSVGIKKTDNAMKVQKIGFAFDWEVRT